MNPINTISNVVKKVFAAEMYALVDEIADHFQLDKELLHDNFVARRLDMYNIRRRGAARGGVPGGGAALRQTAIIEAREVKHHGVTYLLDINTGHVYTNDLSNPVHVGEVLANGDVLLYQATSPTPNQHGHEENDQNGQEDEKYDKKSDKPIQIHLHL
jgi:hypothetical protein